MSKLFQEELSKQDKFGLICFLCVIVFLFPYILLQNIIEHVWIDKQANIKVQDPKNLKQGCLYFVGYKNTKYSKNLNHYYIHQDKLFFSDANNTKGYFTHPVPIDEKYRKFYNDVDSYKGTKCYKVIYLHLDYWIAEKTYIYDYLGMEDF